MIGKWQLMFMVFVGALWCAGASGHQVVENALDVVIGRETIVIDARVAMEQILAVEGDGKGGKEKWAGWAEKHQEYVLGHLMVEVDGRKCVGKATTRPAIEAKRAGAVAGGAADSGMAAYRFEFASGGEPKVVKIYQDMLKDRREMLCACVVRIRQSNQGAFQSALLTWMRFIEFECDWKEVEKGQKAEGGVLRDLGGGEGVETRVEVWATVVAYARHGIEHILSGFDHLLFIGALVLGARGFWDLFKVVTMFTVAHTLTLALSVMNVVSVSSRIVEPMIAASIVFVAVQNIFWPRQARGWSRLAVAFGFGLFHGLGFAGGLKEAMSAMPVSALGVALIAFSVGVEIGHQVVVIPMFGLMQIVRKWRAEEERTVVMGRIVRVGSGMISVGGIYFLIQAIK
jgi:HupE/UreJ protein